MVGSVICVHSCPFVVKSSSAGDDARLPNELRDHFASSIRRAGCGVADQSRSAQVSYAEDDADRRGGRALFKSGRFLVNRVKRSWNKVVVFSTGYGLLRIQSNLRGATLVWSYSTGAAAAARLARVARSIPSRAEPKNTAIL